MSRGTGSSARERWLLVERAVWAVGVVVVDVVDDEALDLLLVPDDGAVEEFSSDRADPAFGKRICDRGADGGLEDLEAFGSEDLVEGVDELAAAVTHERSVSGPNIVSCLLRLRFGIR